MTDRLPAGRMQQCRLLPPDSRAVLAAARHMICCWPRSPAAEALLIDRFGDAATGIAHLVRCLLVGVARHARRRPLFGAPCCAAVLADEAELLEAIGLDGAEADPSALVRLAGDPRAARFADLARLIGETAARERRTDCGAFAADAPY
jgi:hypothetical protein